MATSAGRGGGKSPTNVTKHLKGIDFPAQKQDLVKHAQHLKAEKVVIDEIQSMEDRQYDNMADVMKSFGKSQEGSPGGSSQKGQQAGHAKSPAKSHSKSSQQR